MEPGSDSNVNKNVCSTQLFCNKKTFKYPVNRPEHQIANVCGFKYFF